jgi:hypothetical protein
MKTQPRVVEMKIETSAENAARFSLIYARRGDMSYIADRVSRNMLSEPERQFLADYLLGKIKPRKRRDHTPFGKALIRHAVIFYRAQNWPQEAAVKKVCEKLHVKRSYVFQLLKGIDYPKRIAAMKAQYPKLAELSP